MKDFFDQKPEIIIPKSTEEYKQEIIDASRVAIDELIKVLREPIITGDRESDLAADRLKNASATKKLAMIDALEMIARIDVEQTQLEDGKGAETPAIGFAEKNAK